MSVSVWTEICEKLEDLSKVTAVGMRFEFQKYLVYVTDAALTLGL